MLLLVLLKWLMDSLNCLFIIQLCYLIALCPCICQCCKVLFVVKMKGARQSYQKSCFGNQNDSSGEVITHTTTFVMTKDRLLIKTERTRSNPTKITWPTMPGSTQRQKHLLRVSHHANEVAWRDIFLMKIGQNQLRLVVFGALSSHWRR